MCIQLLLVLVSLLAFVSLFSSSREFSGFTPQHGDPPMGKLHIERDLDTFFAQVIVTCESIERQSKYHLDRRKRDVMH